MINLVFMNADATPKNTAIRCDAASVPNIMAWYAAFCGGDRYTVAANGRDVAMDMNGCPTLAALRKIEGEEG
ncbi:hypothetical protein [Pararhodobacter sp. CCB-MM2]|uniref:hypothetical protein n=1 Tax=Pararhodobacter sp. CCB-MM2 TaxID=1786003 RepID=UPI00082E354D|nr:hypothetical protein [Pararhodobacter sp. CCB-MM2]